MSEENKEKHEIKDMFGESRTVSDVEDYNETIAKEIKEWGTLLQKSQAIQSIIERLQRCKIAIGPKVPATNNAVFLRELKAKEKELKLVFFANSPVFAEISTMLPLGNDIISGFINYLYTKAITFHVTNLNQITTLNIEGPIRAIQFLSQNVNIIEKGSSHKKSLEKLREEYLEAKESIDTTTKEILADFKSTKQSLENAWKLQIDQLHENAKNSLDEFHKKETDLFQNFQNAQNELAKIYERNLNEEMLEIKRLEHLFGEKLKLEEPAKFWKQKEEAHQFNSYISLGILFLLICGSLAFFGWAFMAWMDNPKFLEKFSYHHWQAAILYGTLLTFDVFLIRTVAKMMFSSMHLRRDAEERHILANFYLSLSSKGKLDPTSELIILQALFSRSETGLLGKDQGPTMPSIANEIIGKHLKS